MKQLGTVLVFKAGVSKEAATAALKSIAPLLDDGYAAEFDPVAKKYQRRRFALHEFDNKYGGPVWYVP